MGLSPDCRSVVRGGMSSVRREVGAAAHVGGRLVCVAVVSFQSSHQVVRSRLAVFRTHARQDFEDEYLQMAARSLQAVEPVSHRRGLLPWVHGAVASSGRVDARRLW